MTFYITDELYIETKCKENVFLKQFNKQICMSFVLIPLTTMQISPYDDSTTFSMADCIY